MFYSYQQLNASLKKLNVFNFTREFFMSKNRTNLYTCLLAAAKSKLGKSVLLSILALSSATAFADVCRETGCEFKVRGQATREINDYQKAIEKLVSLDS